MPVEIKAKVKAKRLPLLALRGLVQFPGMMLTFDVGRRKSVKAVTAAMESDQRIFLVAQKDISVDDPGADELYAVGCVCRIRLENQLNGETRTADLTRGVWPKGTQTVRASFGSPYCGHIRVTA